MLTHTYVAIWCNYLGHNGLILMWTCTWSQIPEGKKIYPYFEQLKGSKPPKFKFRQTTDKCMHHPFNEIIKSPRYTRGDFMFLYRFVRRRRLQILVHAITFEQLFGFLSFLARLLVLTYSLTDLISGDFRRDLDLEFSRSNIKLAISQPKMVRLPRNEKQTHRLNSRLQMGPSGLTLTLTLNFQGQIWNWLYLSQKLSDCHETKSKHIDWTLGFKWDHRVWPWPWPWPWIFKVKYGIGYISAKNGPIATKQKANTSTEL